MSALFVQKGPVPLLVSFRANDSTIPTNDELLV